MTNRRSLLAMISIASACLLIDAPPSTAADAPPTGKPWLDMDYGPYLTTTVEAPEPAGNFAYKGIVVRVGKANNETIVFDTDTLRYSAGGSGGKLALLGVAFDGAHWAYPKTNGPIAFSNPVGPGWAKPGDASDKAFSAAGRFKVRTPQPFGATCANTGAILT